MKTDTRPRGADGLQACEEWNEKYPPGTEVIVTLDGGAQIRTKTRSDATVLGGHTPVIWVDGIVGCYRLDRVAPVNPSAEAQAG
jgi:hypothetical protein